MVICLALAYYFKPMTMNDVKKEPHFTAEVIEELDEAIMVTMNGKDNDSHTGDKAVVSLDVKLKDGVTKFKTGDKVEVYYDGVIAESYPVQINNVYAIVRIGE